MRSRVAVTFLSLVAFPATLRAATVQEFPTPAPASDIVAGPDGNLWFTETSANKIGKMTTDGVTIEYPIPTPGSAPGGITVGPDGNLWFTESASRIGKITTGGVITEYLLPNGGDPASITAGPDGALWFTEYLAKRIGRMTTGGVVAEFEVPLEPTGITAGPDGALWFTARGMIGRITTSGAVSQFPILSPFPDPTGIVAGPDGALWFTLYYDAIGRITTDGTITQFPLQFAAFPSGICVGPDGSLWFAEVTGNRIGRITPSGEVSDYRVPWDAAQPVVTAAGPDGNIWFTMPPRSSIGRLLLSTTAPGFYTVPPCRVVDTRDPSGPYGGPAVPAGTERGFLVAGRCGVSFDAKALALNVTVTEPAGSGHLTVYRSFTTRPATSNVNFRAGQTRAGASLVAPWNVGQSWPFDVTVWNGSDGPAHVIIDVSGYFQ